MRDCAVSSVSQSVVQLSSVEPASEGELGSNLSKKPGGGEDSGEELSGSATSVKRLAKRNVDGGTSISSRGGEDSGDVVSCATDKGRLFGRGVTNSSCSFGS